jgi:hypothetical protein
MCSQRNGSLIKHLENKTMYALTKKTLTTNDFNEHTFAVHAYKMSETFIRSCEAANSNNVGLDKFRNNANPAIYDSYVPTFDYYLVGKVLSMSPERQPHFEQFVETNKFEMEEERNERAYQWLMYNAVYELFSSYILYAFFRTACLGESTDEVLDYLAWVETIRDDENNTFILFSDTVHPIEVR